MHTYVQDNCPLFLKNFKLTVQAVSRFKWNIWPVEVLENNISKQNP